MQAFADQARRQGGTIAFIPTMGFLHEGHLSLIREGCRHGDEVVVSIFVNPTQFGPGEDLDTYPRAFERDCELAEKAGATLIFHPNREDLYGENYQTYVTLEKLPFHLCGLSRPVFFRGVATVVTKLFNIVKPHVAVFGEKDYQQLMVIRRMVRDLNFDIRIIGGPIVREHDGLAMSSRNSYLSPEERKRALCLSQALNQAGKMVQAGVRNVSELIAAARKIIEVHPDAVIDYIEIFDPETIESLTVVDSPARMALAVKIGKTRLIDNTLLTP
ncbi:Pantothenate synthetase [Desulfococcus multivorans DSM 2059]|jgi:pantoate--beta-alanine ligase|uniref:Pantothenate synthetase n=2 Tax=Desulfococcaceae TaxID=2931039 RepID=S7TDQ4_DESML|nr:PanC: pantothenate synthetase (pantoate--beta-alanine ligase) [Desulfococcus multivorans]EPR35317.1 Pantothenate synthetase [Desulfococcus multivorans DSM 2059]SJZ45877.1 pantothenate synthetase [Desulfococcus multivorans DSM 2059]